MRRGLQLFVLAVALSGSATACSGLADVGGSGDKDAAWSPDGGRLAYVRYDIGRDDCESSIWVRDAEGGGDRKLIDGGEHPDWSPDGKRIAFVWVEYEDLGIGRGGIAVMDADGSNVRRILSSRDIDSFSACSTDALNDPAWSPDGRQIAFSDPSVPGIYVMRPDGTRRRRITNRYDLFPDWSPDGRQLVFLHVPADSNEPEVTVIKRDGTGRRVVTTSQSLVGRGDDTLQGVRPAWSPLGSQIAYPDFLDIALIDSDDGHWTRLDLECGPPGDCWSPSWSPDGKQIAFAKGLIGADQSIELTDVPNR